MKRKLRKAAEASAPPLAVQPPGPVAEEAAAIPSREARSKGRKIVFQGVVRQVLGGQALSVLARDGSVYKVRAENHPWVLRGDVWSLLSAIRLNEVITVVGRAIGHTVWAARVVPVTEGAKKK